MKTYSYMGERHLNIVSFAVPFPPLYGGVQDVFYRITALQRAGVTIHLHCFTKALEKQPALLNHCASVHYYQRNSKLQSLSLHTPYIVASRQHEELNKVLLQNDYPILLEGIHCSGVTADPRFASRQIVLRLHNVEHRYYRTLASTISNPAKRLYYLAESKMLQRYEKRIAGRVALLPISRADETYYRESFAATNVDFLPAFHGNTLTIPEGAGSYALYHGNLAISENALAARWLLENVFVKHMMPLVVAGSNAPLWLKHLVAHRDGARLINDPSVSHLSELIQNAQCHVLPSFNNTGVKLKLINSLFSGRHCITNDAGALGTGLENCLHIANSGEEMRKVIIKLADRPLTEAEKITRRESLDSLYDDDTNAQQIIRKLW